VGMYGAATELPSATASWTGSTESKARWPRPLLCQRLCCRLNHTDRRGRSYAPGSIFTTALPPPVCAAATAAIRHPKSLELGTRTPRSVRRAPR
jgi:hypothetical protein